MSVAKTIEISAESPEGFDHAIREGIKKASASIDNLQSVWVKDQKISIGTDGNPQKFRVWLKATFELN